MNGTATFGDKWHPRRAFCDAHFNRHATIRDESNDDKRDGGIRNCGRRHIAGLLPADDASAEPPRKSEVAARQPVVGWRNYTGADSWSISSWFGGDNPAFDSSGNPSDSGGSDSGGGADGGGGDGGGGAIVRVCGQRAAF